jgi:hypothetical protein
MIWASSNGGAGAAAVRGRGTGIGGGDGIYGWEVWVAEGHQSGARRWVARIAYCVAGAHSSPHDPKAPLGSDYRINVDKPPDNMLIYIQVLVFDEYYDKY